MAAIDEFGRCNEAIYGVIDSIACEICDMWFHRECAKLSKLQFKFLQGPSSHWFCKSCSNATNNLERDIRDLNAAHAYIAEQLMLPKAGLSDESIGRRIDDAVALAMPEIPADNLPLLIFVVFPAN